MTDSVLGTSSLRALSVRQPWAWLIVNGYKDIENRSRRTQHRGPLLIHASQTFDWDGWTKAVDLCRDMLIPLPEFHALERGGIVGVTQVLGCVDHSTSQWFFGPCGYTLADSRPLAFQPCRGRLGLFVPDVCRSEAA